MRTREDRKQMLTGGASQGGGPAGYYGNGADPGNGGYGSPEGKKKRSGKRIVRNIFLSLLIVCLVALLGVYIAGVLYFKDRFFWHTKINGFDASEMTVEQVESRIGAQIGSYKLTIEERGGTQETITADQIDYHYVSKGETSTFKQSQNMFLWPRCLWEETAFTFDSSAQYDEELLREVISGLDCLDEDKVTKPQDAYIDYLDGSYLVIQEVEGNQLISHLAQQVIQEAIDFGNAKVSLEEKNCYETPKKRQDDAAMNATVETLNTMISTNITYLFGENLEQLDGETVREWLSYDDDGNVSISEESVYSYVQGLADKYDTADKPREFVTSKGNTVSVSGGYYGWVVDQDTTASNLMEYIRTGYQGECYADFAQTAVSWENSDLGYSYVEIDLGSQHVWLYIDGQLVVETDCVSGNMAYEDRITPAGTYTLYYKESPSVLKGENAEYETPVTYWMPFNGGIGLHDATWRSSFGGSIYLTDGSHGCINLPLEAAKTIYENVYDGIPIICYY